MLYALFNSEERAFTILKSHTIPFTALAACIALAFSVSSHSQVPSSAPLELAKTFTLPAEIAGNFDHFEVDLKRRRLFSTPEDYKAVLVIDIDTGKVIHTIDGIQRPHAILYREDTDRLYITDGIDGSVRVFDGESYHPVARIPLLKDADAIGYDLSRKYLYVENGGGDAGQKHSMLNVIDTTTDAKITQLSIDGETLESMSLDIYRPRLYINDKATNHVVVLDRLHNKQVADWPVTMGKENVAMALDEQHQRLFIGCRGGQIVVFDTNTGKELQMLRIAAGVDDVIFDSATHRIYAATDGELDVFEQKDLDHYISLGSVKTGAHGRTARLVPQLNQLFVAIPKSDSESAHILVYTPVNLPAIKPAPVEIREPVHAPRAQEILLETLAAHPTFRKMGLHLIPPGGDKMVIVANGNASRIGVPTSESDFAAVKEGKIYGKKNDDGQYFNMKMPLLDSQNRKIGILVMEIPCTTVATEEEAERAAEEIHSEISKQIPSADSLFSNAK